jgi:hypothetical protein
MVRCTVNKRQATFHVNKKSGRHTLDILEAEWRGRKLAFSLNHSVSTDVLGTRKAETDSF